MVDEAKRSSREEETKIYIPRRKALVKLWYEATFVFLKTFSLENRGFRVLKNEKGPLLIFSLENKGFGVVKNEKDFLVIENMGKLS